MRSRRAPDPASRRPLRCPRPRAAAITTGSSASTPCGPSPSLRAMNKYAHMAIRHWQTFLPDRVQAIPESDRTRFFTELGEQAAIEIEELQMQLAGPDPVGEEYLEKVGRLNAARMQAEEIVLRELILPAPSHDPEEEDDSLPEADLQFYEDLRRIGTERRRVAFSPPRASSSRRVVRRRASRRTSRALRLLADVERQDREATVEVQRTLAAWSGWGAVPGVFDEDRGEWAQAALGTAGAGRRGRVRRGAAHDH